MLGIGEAIGGLTSLASSIIGGVQASKAAKNYERDTQAALSSATRAQQNAINAYKTSQAGVIDAQEAETRELFNRDYYTDATSRAEVANVLRNSRQRQDRNLDAAANMSAITGETPEAAMARQRAANEAEADAVAAATATASSAKDRAKSTYAQQQANTSSMRTNLNQLSMQNQLALEQSTLANNMNMQGKLYEMKNSAAQATAAGGSAVGGSIMGAFGK